MAVVTFAISTVPDLSCKDQNHDTDDEPLQSVRLTGLGQINGDHDDVADFVSVLLVGGCLMEVVDTKDQRCSIQNIPVVDEQLVIVD